MKLYLYPFFLFVFFSSSDTIAQLCKGTLGAPIFMETFGAGVNAGPSLPAGITTYNYTASWPSDGQYTISNTSNPPPGNVHWYYNGADHTGDVNGYMFVVNASYAPGEFFRRTVTGLCANTTYVFSAWIANVNNINTVNFCQENDPPYIHPNVLFKVENPVTMKIDSVSTGDILPGAANIVWHEFGFTFSTGPGQTSVYLVMVNNSPGGCGNDLLIDDISFRPCGPSTSIAAIPSKKVYCTGDNILLDAIIGAGYNNPVYQWQFSNDGGFSWQDIPGATNQDLALNNITMGQAGQYRLILAENGNIHLNKCRIITDTIGIHLVKSPSVSAASAPGSICSGYSSTLSVTGATTYIWNTGSKGTTVHVSPSVTSSYTVTGTDIATGCTGQASVSVTVNTNPVAPVVTVPATICSGSAATLTATAPGGTYNWYEVAAGGTALHAGSSFNTPPLNATKTYHVEVISAMGCTSVSRTPVTVVVASNPVSPVVTAATICSGNAATLTATAPGGIYKWYEASTGGTAIHTGPAYKTPLLKTATTYYVEVVSADACTSVSRTPVTVSIAEVKAQFTATPATGTAPLKVDFINLSTGAASYHWKLENQYESTSKHASHTYSRKGQGATYEVILIAMHPLGCTDTAKITITVDPFSKLIIPNVFTPNGDGVNDLFKVESIGLTFVKAELFNRWGLKMHEWDSVHGSWDGRTSSGLEVPEGTYYYFIAAKGMDGKEYKFKGHFTLLR